MKIRHYFLIILELCIVINGKSAVYNTLPKGVKALNYKQVYIPEIDGFFQGANQDKSIYLKEKITARTLQGLNSGIDYFLKSLKEASPEAYENFSLGEHEMKGRYQVDVSSFGAGYGVTDRLTVYAGVPFYRASGSFEYRQTEDESYSIDLLRQNSHRSSANELTYQITKMLPKKNISIMQSLIVNHLGYKEMGSWEAEGFGDTEAGFIYRLTNLKNKGVSIGGGIVLPTGREDDPDLIQDFGFGDGQTDIFSEIAAGINPYMSSFDFSFKSRYTHQIAKDKELRAPEATDLPLTKRKLIFNQKLGDFVDVILGTSYKATSWLGLNVDYVLYYKFKDVYSSSDSQADLVLEADTERYSRSIRIMAEFSTLNLYVQKKFMVPVQLGLSGQRMFGGKNTAKYDRFDLDVKIFF